MAAQHDLRILYGNLNHAALSNTQILATAEEVSADVLALAEPYLYRNRVPSTTWLQHVEGRAALLFRPHLATCTTRLPCSIANVVYCRLRTINIVAVYLPPSEDITVPLATLTGFVLSLSGPVIVIGDFNATTALIQGQTTNSRGESLEAFLYATQFDVLNPATPTWQRNGFLSRTLDYALCLGLPGSSCEVRSDIDSCSDHHFLQLLFPSPHTIPPAPLGTHLNKEELRHLVKDTDLLVPEFFNSAEEIDLCVSRLTQQLQEMLHTATRLHQPKPTSLHWWKPELSVYRRALNRLRRQLLNNPPPLVQQILVLVQRSLRRLYKSAMFRAKTTAWRELITRDTAWGKPYRVLRKVRSRQTFPPLLKPDGTRCTTPEEAYSLLLQDKFSATPSLHWNFQYQFPLAEGPAPRVSARWLGNVIRALDNRKAPGPDGIPNSMIKLVHKHHPEVLPSIFTACLTFGHFPDPWKQGKVVFIPKLGKDPATTDGHRPITLLCGFGKLLEVVLNVTLVDHLESEKLLQPEQYGFRRHRSTEDAIHDALKKIRETRANNWYTAGISFDIKGAFDNASWSAILQAPELANVPSYVRRCLFSYFENRSVECHGSTRRLERGCPQGSVLGPTLWNVVHNGVISRLSPLYPGVTCYADDTLVVVGADCKITLQAECTLCISRVTSMVAVNGLELNQNKTEILAFVDSPSQLQIHQPEKHGWPRVKFLGREMKVLRSIRYLGVMVDNNLRWDVHIKAALSRCSAALLPLNSLCRRTFGYSNSARNVMIQGAVHTHLLYCSTIWYHRLESAPIRRAVESLQRRGDILGTRCYSTTSASAAAILQGNQPLDIRITRRSIRWLVQHNQEIPFWGPYTPITEWPPNKAWEAASTAEWQRRWSTSATGEWTRQLFPTIKIRLRTDLKNINFWLAQGLTGHGVFGAFLHRFRRREDPSCPCGAEEQTPRHVFRHCPLYQSGRPIVWIPVGEAHLEYMEQVVRTLWDVENPGHTLTLSTPTHHREERRQRRGTTTRRERVSDAVEPP